MFIKINKGKSARGLLEYLINQRDGENGHERGEIIGGTTAGRNAREIAAELALFRQLRPTVKKAVVHFSINLPPTEREIDNDTYNAIANQFMQRMGYQDCPYTCVRHRDREHQHVHIAAIKIDADGKTVSESGDFKRAAAIARQLETEFNLIPISEESQPMTPNQKALIEQRLETSSGAAKEKLINLVPGIACTDLDLTDERRRNYKRQLLEEEYQCSIGAMVLDDLQYIKRTPAGLIITIRPKGKLIDNGDKVTAEHMSDSEAARRLIDFALMKNWLSVEFTGSNEFVRLAMIEALARGLNVVPRNAEQAVIWEQVKAANAATLNPAPVFRLDNAGIMDRLAKRRSQGENQPGPTQPTRRPFSPQ
jgi:hypothetical protein